MTAWEYSETQQQVSETSTRLLMCGIRRSMRTSTSMTSARQTFLRTSGSSSVDRKNRLYTTQSFTDTFNKLIFHAMHVPIAESSLLHITND